MWQIKIIISSQSQSLCPPNVAGWWHNLRVPTNRYVRLWSRCLARLRHKLKPFYLHYHSAYGHQTWQDSNLHGWASTRRHMTLWSHGLAKSCKKLKPLHSHYHSAYGHQTWQNGDLLWNLLDHLVTWSCKMTII